ncbi:TPA: adhesin [Escherichia coli]|nr:adhesin [Escherichia coli]
MKKLFSTLPVLSALVSAPAFSGWSNVIFYAFHSTSSYNSGRMTILDRGQFVIPWNKGLSYADYVRCDAGPFISGVYFQEYIAWTLVPKKAKTTDGHTVFFTVQDSSGWSEENQADNDYYFFLNGYEWDTWTNNAEPVCVGPNGLASTKTLNKNFNNITFNLLVPADLPKGHYDVPIKYINGIQHHFYSDWRAHYKMPYNLVKSLPAANTLNLSFDIVGGCKPSSQNITIDHGDLAIDKANGNYASKDFSITCDVPVSIKLTLLSNTQSTYNSQDFSVGLGHGLDSIIYLDGIKRKEETLRWTSAGSKTVTIGSQLYGDISKITAGQLSGSMTMTLNIP